MKRPFFYIIIFGTLNACDLRICPVSRVYRKNSCLCLSNESTLQQTFDNVQGSIYDLAFESILKIQISVWNDSTITYELL